MWPLECRQILQTTAIFPKLEAAYGNKKENCKHAEVVSRSKHLAGAQLYRHKAQKSKFLPERHSGTPRAEAASREGRQARKPCPKAGSRDIEDRVCNKLLHRHLAETVARFWLSGEF